MLKTSIIGHIGADAVVQSSNGKEFTTLRVAHTDKWTGADGVAHEETVWADIILQGKPAVLPYLTRGQLVYAEGNTSLRTYSSPKDRCIKAGITINARSIELLGGKSEDVPTVLYKATDGTEVHVKKYYQSEDCVLTETDEISTPLISRSGEKYVADYLGWVTKATEE